MVKLSLQIGDPASACDRWSEAHARAEALIRDATALAKHGEETERKLEKAGTPADHDARSHDPDHLSATAHRKTITPFSSGAPIPDPAQRFPSTSRQTPSAAPGPASPSLRPSARRRLSFGVGSRRRSASQSLFGRSTLFDARPRDRRFKPAAEPLNRLRPRRRSRRESR
jgi:hypothetical protein